MPSWHTLQALCRDTPVEVAREPGKGLGLRVRSRLGAGDVAAWYGVGRAGKSGLSEYAIESGSVLWDVGESSWRKPEGGTAWMGPLANEPGEGEAVNCELHSPEGGAKGRFARFELRTLHAIEAGCFLLWDYGPSYLRAYK